jgi:hypothetical protein
MLEQARHLEKKLVAVLQNEFNYFLLHFMSASILHPEFKNKKSIQFLLITYFDQMCRKSFIYTLNFATRNYCTKSQLS